MFVNKSILSNRPNNYLNLAMTLLPRNNCMLGKENCIRYSVGIGLNSRCISFNPFVPNAPFLYSRNASETVRFSDEKGRGRVLWERMG